MKLVVILFVITLVNAVPQFQQQEYDSNDQLNPLNDEEAQQEAKEQNKRTLLGHTFIGSTRHVGVHPSGFKYLLGYGPVGYYPYTKPVTILKPVMHTHGWKPILRVPVSKPVFKPIVPIVPVKPVHHHPPHVHVHPVHPVHPVQPVQPVQPVHPVHPEPVHPHPVHPVQPVIPIQKPIAPPTFVKPLVPFQPQLPYLYPFFKPLSFQPQVYQPALQIQPPVISPVVHQPVVHQSPVFAPQFPQFFPRFVNQFPVPLPGVANPVGPIEHTNSVHTSYSSTFPKHPIIGVHTPPPAVPFTPSPHFVHPAAQPPFIQQVHPVAQPPFVHQIQPPVEQHLPGPPNAFPVPIQPHLLHVIRHFPHLFKHITPLYPVNNPAETPVAELPQPIVPPATIHSPFNPQDTGSSVQIPEHLPEHPNYRPDIQNYYPIQPDQGVHNVPDYQEQDNSFIHHQPQPNQPAPQTPLYLPPHPFLRQGGPVQEPINSVQTEFSATYPRNARIQLPSIGLEPPYRRSDNRMK